MTTTLHSGADSEPKRLHAGTLSERIVGYSRAIAVADTSNIDRGTMTMPEAMEAKAEGAFRNMRLALAHFGAGLGHVERARIFGPDPAPMDRVHPVIGREFAAIWR